MFSASRRRTSAQSLALSPLSASPCRRSRDPSEANREAWCSASCLPLSRLSASRSTPHLSAASWEEAATRRSASARAATSSIRSPPFSAPILVSPRRRLAMTPSSSAILPRRLEAVALSRCSASRKAGWDAAAVPSACRQIATSLESMSRWATMQAASSRAPASARSAVASSSRRRTLLERSVMNSPRASCSWASTTWRSAASSLARCRSESSTCKRRPSSACAQPASVFALACAATSVCNALVVASQPMTSRCSSLLSRCKRSAAPAKRARSATSASDCCNCCCDLWRNSMTSPCFARTSSHVWRSASWRS
mmetsp:Transcript_14771/g.40803  ORF Transcript_14771/g.40803 Transcript_14771/m.40803 type:complete len:312 (-) Transcript_14771:377-1312(-)